MIRAGHRHIQWGLMSVSLSPSVSRSLNNICRNVLYEFTCILAPLDYETTHAHKYIYICTNKLRISVLIHMYINIKHIQYPIFVPHVLMFDPYFPITSHDLPSLYRGETPSSHAAMTPTFDRTVLDQLLDGFLLLWRPWDLRVMLWSSMNDH